MLWIAWYLSGNRRTHCFINRTNLLHFQSLRSSLSSTIAFQLQSTNSFAQKHHQNTIQKPGPFFLKKNPSQWTPYQRLHRPAPSGPIAAAWSSETPVRAVNRVCVARYHLKMLGLTRKRTRPRRLVHVATIATARPSAPTVGTFSYFSNRALNAFYDDYEKSPEDVWVFTNSVFFFPTMWFNIYSQLQNQR